MKITFETVFNIGDEVYHRLEENQKGIIIDILYKARIKVVEYRVVFGSHPDETVWCDVLELSETPVF